MSALDERHCRAQKPGRPEVLCGRHRGHDKEPGDTGHRQRGADGGATWRDPLKAVVAGQELVVLRHALCDTGIGIAGYFQVTLPDGRDLRVCGIWDDSYRVPENVDRVWCSEIAWLDNEPVETQDENGVVIELDIGGGLLDHISVESMAIAIERAVRRRGGS